MRFSNREEAGRRLAQLLEVYREERPVVVGIPRGGVPVAYEVARALGAPLEVCVVRKVGAPSFPELGVGAVAEGGLSFVNRDLVKDTGLTQRALDGLLEQKQQEVEARVELYRAGRSKVSLRGRTVLLVDDGIATGGTVRAAVLALRAQTPARIILGAPVAAAQALEELAPLVDDMICLHTTPALYAIGIWYDDFQQVSDGDVVDLLTAAQKPVRAAPQSSAVVYDPEEVSVALEDVVLQGTLAVPPRPMGLVLFAHGSGSSHLSPRNRHVASVLQHAGLATLLFDLLTADEETIDEQTTELRFDIPFLARRLIQVTDWTQSSPALRAFPVGYFGSSTGAAAALEAAALRPERVRAVVSRGGRPDLAEDGLSRVRAATLFIVGGDDRAVLRLNQQAFARLNTVRKLVVVPGATHLFEEPGALDAVARLAAEWFVEQLGRQAPAQAAAQESPRNG